MMSADDLTQCIPIIEKAGEYFTGRANKLGTVRKIFKRAYRQHLIEMQEDAALGRYGMTMQEFTRRGKKNLSEKMYEGIRQKIEGVRVKSDFLIAGFDGVKRPHIFKVSEGDSGEIVDSVYDKPGFCAIGSGTWIAETILYSLGQAVDSTFHETIFNTCAAKFMAEKASDIGKATYLYSKKPGSSVFMNVGGMIEAIRDAWEKSGCPRVPDGIIKDIANIYHPRCG